MNAETTLLELHETLADRFLGSAVVVDDQALAPKGAVEEGRRQQEGADAAPEEPLPVPAARGVQAEIVVPGNDEGRQHDFDAHRVIEAFARVGITCAVLSPEPNDEVADTLRALLPVAANSDLLVTDWVQHGDDGGKTRELIGNLLEQDDPPRHRVIAVYTGEPKLDDVHRQLCELIDAKVDRGDLVVEDERLAVHKGSVRAVVIAKDREPPAPGVPDRRVGYEQLPARLRQEFARSTVGLVRGVGLAALGAVRKDTHRVLARLDPSLDAGYVGHRLAQKAPADAEGHLTGIITAELAAVLAEHDIGVQADARASTLWLDHDADGEPPDPERRYTTGSDGPQLAVDDVATLLDLGLGDSSAARALDLAAPADAGKLSNSVCANPTKLLTTDDDDAYAANLRFTALMSVQTSYGRPDRSLRLGTVVRTDSGQLLLCVQPVCDSVRIGEWRQFPFARLEPQASFKGADLVVADTDQQIAVKVLDKPYQLIGLVFEPGQDGTVRPADESQPTYIAQQPFFGVTVSERPPGIALRWVCQLRAGLDQQRASGIGQQFSRVGTAEPEILNRAG